MAFALDFNSSLITWLCPTLTVIPTSKSSKVATGTGNQPAFNPGHGAMQVETLCAQGPAPVSWTVEDSGNYSYHDVAASHSSVSPRRTELVYPEPSEDPVHTYISNNVVVMSGKNNDLLGLSSMAEPDEDDGQGPWTAVQLCRSKSLGNIRNMERNLFKVPAVLIKEQQATVKAAEKGLTPSQKELIHCRDEKVRSQNWVHNCSASREAGPSNYLAKGKFTDHNNEISDQELNIKAQKAALK
ncbi:hypothetical protein GYMLUDRAFT_61780 [Collybiopsis luxurians FD-317 M1]|uniref:Uncharacterized protein n=1 Tax=Collybiopsis luxurians FD-317 M1 TaxID=944289 RepID=A0A0D0CN80_9AGAR|nr:hypothetical protein GYMLUDRAFT_61780 [Collybiopsis luxurians FD-317 M1]